MKKQNGICSEYGVESAPSHDGEMLGIALETIGKIPINGLRHQAESGTCGWYIWCGVEFSKDTDFFKPLHVKHLYKYLPAIKKYLSLPPGYRFLIADDYEDVWFDDTLISF